MPEQASIPTAIAEPAPGLGPVRAKERIETIDILRGFALFGILVVNMADFSWSGSLRPLAEVWTEPSDRAVVWFIALFAERKFYSLFSFLFGLGFALQMGRAEARGVRFFPVYRRRLLVLLLIGLAHFLFLWEGDILHSYAVLGFLLLLFRARSPRTIVRWVIITLLIPIVFWAAVGFHQARERMRPEQVAERKVEAQQYFRTHSQGTYREMMAERAGELADGWTSPGLYLLGMPKWFVMFLLGLYAGRRRIFEDLPAHLPFIRKVLWWGLGLSLTGSLVWVWMVVVPTNLLDPSVYVLGGRSTLPYSSSLVGVVFIAIGPPALCFFYAAALTLLAQRERWKIRLAPLAAVGRMALTNYLFQSLVFTTIFNSYGLGLYGKVGPALILALAVLIFTLQILLSVWWMRRFRFGPAEWLWRTLTYGKLQPMRAKQTAA